jgi:hypothetical protein
VADSRMVAMADSPRVACQPWLTLQLAGVSEGGHPNVRQLLEPDNRLEAVPRAPRRGVSRRALAAVTVRAASSGQS